MKPKILVAFDFSTSAERALAWAADLQETTGAAPLQLVHAINSRPPGTGDVPLEILLPNEDEISGIERSMVEVARKQGATARAEVVIQPGAVGDIVLDVARSMGADLIVMGTHGRTGVKRLLLGSVAEHVLRHADCPVVTVHAPKDGDAGSPSSSAGIRDASP